MPWLLNASVAIKTHLGYQLFIKYTDKDNNALLSMRSNSNSRYKIKLKKPKAKHVLF